MDITTLELPIRRERRTSGVPFLFSDTSVNVCYDNAIASVIADDSTIGESIPSIQSTSATTSDVEIASLSSSVASTPMKSRPSHSRNRSRSSSNLSAIEGDYNFDFIGDIVESEVSSFVKSLQEPKYAKALSGTEIGWLFQEFYKQLRAKLEAQFQKPSESSSEGLALLSRDELLLHRRRRQRQTRCIEHALDLAEDELTSEFYDKLLDYGGESSPDKEYDRKLQQRIDCFKRSPELRSQLRTVLGISEKLENDLNQPGGAASCIGNIVGHRTPHAKLTSLVKAHQAVVTILDNGEEKSGADLILPAFVSAVTSSTLTMHWQTSTYIRRFRRSECLAAHNAYCLTNFDATLQFLEAVTFESVPDGIDPQIFAAPLTHSRSRSSSQSSRVSNGSRLSGPLGILGSFGISYRNIISRLGNTESSTDVSTSQPAQPVPVQPAQELTKIGAQEELPIVERFMQTEFEYLTMDDVRSLLNEYRRLATFAKARWTES